LFLHLACWVFHGQDKIAEYILNLTDIPMGPEELQLESKAALKAIEL
jgi:hypothetical protein